LSDQQEVSIPFYILDFQRSVMGLLGEVKTQIVGLRADFNQMSVTSLSTIDRVTEIEKQQSARSHGCPEIQELMANYKAEKSAKESKEKALQEVESRQNTWMNGVGFPILRWVGIIALAIAMIHAAEVLKIIGAK
jgi:hypothetical protein